MEKRDRRGRPPIARKLRTSSRTFSISEMTDTAISAVARRLRTSRSDVISRALATAFPQDFEHLTERDKKSS